MAPTSSIDRARALVDDAERIVVLTGAGISTDSGIPDFRGPDGVWTKNPAAEKAATIQNYVLDADLSRTNWQRRAAGEVWAGTEPNEGHRALVELDRRGKLDTLITQNVDGLHHEAGSDPGRIVEIHGTVREAMCLSCDWRADIEIVLERVRAGDHDPACEVCGGIVKSATISFGQSLVADDLTRSDDAAAACDLLLAVGSSLAVFPIAGVVPRAVQAGAALVIVNLEPTTFDDLADVVVRESISEALPHIVGAVRE